MLGMVIVTTLFVGLALVALWACVEDDREERAQTKKTVRADADADPPIAAAAEHSLEGALFACLLRHEISPAQYRRAVEQLAAREDDRHPLRVPPEAGSDAGKI